MAYIKSVFIETAVLWELRLRRVYISIALVLVLLTVLSLATQGTVGLLNIFVLPGLALLLLFGYGLARHFGCSCVYNLLANLLLGYLGLAIFSSAELDERVQILLLPLIPLWFYLLNPLWLYNLISAALLIALLAMSETVFPAAESINLVLYSYTVVWGVLISVELVARRERERQPSPLHYNDEAEVITPPALLRILEATVANSIRYSHPLVLTMFEFTTISAREQTLLAPGSAYERKLLSSVVANIRRGDTLAKWRGNSFAIIVPDSDRAGAEKLLQKLRRIIAASRLQGLTTVDFRYGLVVLQHESHKELLSLAEQALLASMRQRVAEI